MHVHTHLTAIAACNACADACDHCAIACLQEADLSHMTRCVALDMDCADVCRTMAACLSRDTPFAQVLGSACSVVCEACALECERHPHDHCRRCAQACRQCAAECHRLAA